MNARPLAIGCMRLSTEPDRDEGRATAVLHAAFDAGVTLLDTADVYCLDHRDIGHNERLIARALKSWAGDRARITIATKGGMTRPDGKWEVDGRAKHLVAACERSCRALDVAAIDLYQLHAVDPRTPFTTSVRALASLQRSGLIKSIGLSNVTVGQIEAARRIVSIDAVQVELSVWHDASVLGGVVDYCATHGIRLLAYRPLGGRKSLARTASDATLQAVANRHAATPYEVALAWLEDLHQVVTPLPGVTRVETVASVVRAHRLALSVEDRRELAARFRTSVINPARRTIGTRTDSEILLVMGLPAAGKTTWTTALEKQGYCRLNRDEVGGSLRELIPHLQRAFSDGVRRIVLDNTYITRKSRAPVMHAAAQLDVPVRCHWLTTSIDDAQVNAVTRLITKYGALPSEAELAALQRRDVNAFLPTVMFRYQRELEPPDPTEGFAAIDQIPFHRTWPAHFTNRAAIAWCDDAETFVSLEPTLHKLANSGRRLFGLAWRPDVAEGTRSIEDIEAMFASVRTRTGLPIEFAFCPHGAGPPRCWCRKPLPGLGVVLVHRHLLDPTQCVYVGDGKLDPAFARKLGFTLRSRGLVEP
jgi:aryl-alcohol dehydrogenase-like predicted oxidoreductase/predicted kinase